MTTPSIALHNNPHATTPVADLTDDEVALCHRNAPLMDDEIRERVAGTTDDPREWLARYAAAHEARYGAPWTLP